MEGDDAVMNEAIKFLLGSGMSEAVDVATAFKKTRAAVDARKVEAVGGAVKVALTKLAGGDTIAEWIKVMQRQQDLASDEMFAFGQLVLALGKLKRAMERP